MLKDIVYSCRSYRRFDQSDRISAEILRDWVDSARCTASSANSQVLRYTLITSETACADVFACCAWAGALPDWDGPSEGERPSAYIVMFSDQDVAINDTCTSRDCGIAAQTIMLRATEAGYGGCMIAAFKAKSVADICGLPENLKPELVLALGKPAEEVHIVGPREDGSITYYRDENTVHYVPKRPLEDIVVAEF